MVGRNNYPVEPVVMPLGYGEHKPTEKLAKELAGGVGWHDNQPWEHPPLRERIDYPPSKNRQTKIPLMSDWTPFTGRQGCYPVCRHTPDQCPTKPSYVFSLGQGGAPPAPKVEYVSIPDPEPADTLPGDIGINPMSFDDKPWLDTMPLEEFAKVGYTNYSNDLASNEAPFVKELPYQPGTIKPGDFWREEDRKHRKAAPVKATTTLPDAAMLDRLERYKLWAEADRVGTTVPGVKRVEDHEYDIPTQRYPGRLCSNCLRGYELEPQQRTKTRYCSERCRNQSENTRRRGLVGTVKAGVELSSLAVEGRRIGIDTDDLGFSRLLAGVA